MGQLRRNSRVHNPKVVGSNPTPATILEDHQVDSGGGPGPAGNLCVRPGRFYGSTRRKLCFPPITMLLTFSPSRFTPSKNEEYLRKS